MKTVTHNRISWVWPAFIILTGYNFWQLLHHAMWRDELQAWLIATESRGSFSELWRAMSYEPQPGIWHVLIWLLSHISTDPFLMQLFHFICGTATATLILRYAPFDSVQRLMIITGYFLSFEYLLISRSYALGVLFLFLFCSQYKTLKQKAALGGIVLGFLANTSTYGAILSMALWGGLMADIIMHRKHMTTDDTKKAGGHLVTLSAWYCSLLLISLGLTLFSRGKWAPWWDLDFRGQKALMVALFQLLSMVPVPDFSVEFWNTLALLGKYSAPSAMLYALRAVSGIFVLVSIGLILSRTRIGLWAFLFGSGGMMALQYVKVFGFIRYSGHLFLLFLACVWLGEGPWKTRNAPVPLPILSKTLFVVLLAVNIFAAAVAGYYHANNPFSCGKEMAAFIRENRFDGRPIIGHINYTMPTISGYLGRKIYHVQTGKPESFIRWDDDSQREVSARNIMDFGTSVAAETKQSPLFLFNFPWANQGLRLIHQTTGAIVGDENYYLYEHMPELR